MGVGHAQRGVHEAQLAQTLFCSLFYLKVVSKAPLSLICFLCGLWSHMAGVETLEAPLKDYVALENTLSLTGLLSLNLT